MKGAIGQKHVSFLEDQKEAMKKNAGAFKSFVLNDIGNEVDSKLHAVVRVGCGP